MPTPDYELTESVPVGEIKLVFADNKTIDFDYLFSNTRVVTFLNDINLSANVNVLKTMELLDNSDNVLASWSGNSLVTTVNDSWFMDFAFDVARVRTLRLNYDPSIQPASDATFSAEFNSTGSTVMTVGQIPEPSSAILMALGLAGCIAVGGMRLRKFSGLPV